MKKKFKVAFLLDKSNDWFHPFIKKNTFKFKKKYSFSIEENYKKIVGQDLVFILGYGKLLPIKFLKKNNLNLVVHESDLPKGKGWSPISWQILRGKKKIVICLIEAAKKVDTGDIYLKKEIFFKGDELVDEIREKQAKATVSLCKNFLVKYKNRTIKKTKQKGKSSYYFRRSLKDSLLQFNKTIRQNFNLLRIVDNKKYPAFFYFKNNKYIIHIYKEKK